MTLHYNKSIFIPLWALQNEEYWLEIRNYELEQENWKYEVIVEQTSHSYDSEDGEYIHYGWDIIFSCDTKEERDIFLKVLNTAIKL